MRDNRVISARAFFNGTDELDTANSSLSNMTIEEHLGLGHTWDKPVVKMTVPKNLVW